jgi:hypothetical protein
VSDLSPVRALPTPARSCQEGPAAADACASVLAGSSSSRNSCSREVGSSTTVTCPRMWSTVFSSKIGARSSA